MIIDFAGRFQSAFGFTTKKMSSRLEEEGFDEVIYDSRLLRKAKPHFMELIAA